MKSGSASPQTPEMIVAKRNAESHKKPEAKERMLCIKASTSHALIDISGFDMSSSSPILGVSVEIFTLYNEGFNRRIREHKWKRMI